MTLIACTDVLSQSSASIVVPEVKVAKNGLEFKRYFTEIYAVSNCVFKCGENNTYLTIQLSQPRMVTCKFNKTFIQWRAQKFFGGAVFLKKNLKILSINFFMSANLIFKLSEFLRLFFEKKNAKNDVISPFKKYLTKKLRSWCALPRHFVILASLEKMFDVCQSKMDLVKLYERRSPLGKI